MATSKTNWKKSKQHTITLPSGTEVDIVVPNLSVLIKGGDIPNELLQVAATQTGAAKPPEELDVELVGKLADFQAYLVSKTVVDPAVSQEEVYDLPSEDIELIYEIATRQRDFDAVGHHLAGLEAVESFRKFRGLDSGLAGLGDL